MHGGEAVAVVADGRTVGPLATDPRATDPRSSGSRPLSHSYPIVREFLRQTAELGPRSPLATILGRNPLPLMIRPLYRGAVGEVAVLETLAQLGPDWFALDSSPLAKDAVDEASKHTSDLGHVVIGPGGVFTIGIRNHAGSEIWVGGAVILVDGERVPHIRQAEFEAVRVSQLLTDAVGSKVEVTPCLVIVNPRSLTVASLPKRVAIITPRELRQWLRGLPRVHSREELEQLAAIAENRPTEQGQSPAPDDALTRFWSVQSVVKQARRIRLAWITAGLVLLWIAIFVSLGEIAIELLLP